MTIDTQNISHDIQSMRRDEVRDARYNVLVITQNEIDLELIKKTLEKTRYAKVYEAGNLKSAFKIASHMEIDLIIVDEKLPAAEGFGIIDRLNLRKRLRDVPKLLLITGSFQKERYHSYRDINLDFLRKPLDPVLLQARVNTLFKTMHHRPKNSLFAQMLDRKLHEAREFLGIYKSFLDVDENILFIYDDENRKIVEANRVFLRFFEDIEEVNRILHKPHLFRKFVPYLEDATYLNHYDFLEWTQVAGVSDDFRFALRIEKEGTAYSFSVLLKRVEISALQMYVVKLINNSAFLPATARQGLDDKDRKQINEALELIKEEIERDEKIRSYKRIYFNLRKISEIVNKEETEDILEFEEGRLHLVNAYFVIASLLKSYAGFKTLFLNGTFVDKHLEENHEEIYVRIDPNALLDAVKGIIDSYFTAPVEYDKRRIKVDLFRYDEELRVEIRSSDRREKRPSKEQSVFGKLLGKEEKTTQRSDDAEILPKNVQKAIALLKAEVSHFSADGETIFLIKIPLLEKS